MVCVAWLDKRLCIGAPFVLSNEERKSCQAL